MVYIRFFKTNFRDHHNFIFYCHLSCLELHTIFCVFQMMTWMNSWESYQRTPTLFDIISKHTDLSSRIELFSRLTSRKYICISDVTSLTSNPTDRWRTYGVCKGFFLAHWLFVCYPVHKYYRERSWVNLFSLCRCCASLVIDVLQGAVARSQHMLINSYKAAEISPSLVSASRLVFS